MGQPGSMWGYNLSYNLKHQNQLKAYIVWSLGPTSFKNESLDAKGQHFNLFVCLSTPEFGFRVLVLGLEFWVLGVRV